MTRGYVQHRQSELIHFGKYLTRRAKARCELCGARNTSLSIFEVPPPPADPEFEHCVFICNTCHYQFEDPNYLDSSHWRCLHNSVWSDIPAVQVMAVMQLQLLKGRDWADDLWEHLYLGPEVDGWLSRIH